METESKIDRSRVVCTLAVLGGFMDAYTYVLKGKVFANAETGNVVLLGIALLDGRFHDVLKYILPVVCFSCGIFYSEIVKMSALSEKNKVRFVFIFESVILILIGIIESFVKNIIITSLISFLAAVQVGSFSKVRGNPVATTMITGNLRSASVNFFAAVIKKEKEGAFKAARYFFVIVFFVVGAAGGAFASEALGGKSIYLCPLFILLSYILYIF